MQASAKRLGVEAIGLYQFHRPDPNVPYGDSVGAIRDLLDEGVIEMAGISNANPDQIRQANEILGGRLVSVQNQFSPRFRSSEPELELCTELGIAFLPWSPLGGISNAGELATRHAAFAEVAANHGVEPLPGGPGLGAGAGARRRTDPRGVAARQHHRLRRGGGARAHGRRGRPALRGLSDPTFSNHHRRESP